MTVLCRQKTKKKKYKKLDSFCAFRLETAVWQTTEIWVSRFYTFYRLTIKRLIDMKLQAITHAYGHRLADVHLAGFAPAFTLSLCDSEYARKPPVPIASVVRCHSEKLKDRDLFAEKSLTNCPLFDIDRLFGFCRLLTSDNFFGRTIPRRL